LGLDKTKRPASTKLCIAVLKECIRFMDHEFPKLNKNLEGLRKWKLNDHIFKKYKMEDEELLNSLVNNENL